MKNYNLCVKKEKKKNQTEVYNLYGQQGFRRVIYIYISKMGAFLLLVSALKEV